jgi:hypothetical protein
MTAKEKANELVGKCFDTFINDEEEHYVEIAWRLSKQCALIAVDEIINTDMLIDEDTYVMTPSYLQYWDKVKQEIEKL